VKKIDVQVKRLAHAADLPLPTYQSELAAGLDLMAAIPRDAPMVLAPGEYAMVPTGLCMALPLGTEAQVRPRSGLAARYGVTVLNAPGTVDADFRGEIQVILINHGSRPFTIERGMRVAQLVIATTMQANICESAILGDTTRGVGGFGSTGSSSGGSGSDG
jgi:dUTP pyrophosphatase